MTDSDTENSRDLGVEFGPLNEVLDEEDYPIANETLIEKYGEYELELSGGTQILGEVLARIEEETHESPGAVRQTVLAMVGDEAVGRKGYTDRDPPRGRESRPEKSL